MGIRLFVVGMVSLIMILIPHSVLCDEKNKSKSPITEEYIVAEGECFPPCRSGYLCHNGDCISKCNPPCPEDMVCCDDGECSTKNSVSDLIALRMKMRTISSMMKVSSADSVIQGVIIKTNAPNSKLLIDDTIFVFDSTLYLNMPTGSYRVYLKAPERLQKYHRFKVANGDAFEITVPLRPIRINAGGAFGPGLTDRTLSLSANFDIGLHVKAKHFFGITGNYVDIFNNSFERLNGPPDGIYPDTIRYIHKDCFGFGLTYGYTGFNIHNGITLMPRISVGYWLYEDKVTYTEKYVQNNILEYNNIDELATNNYKHYFVKPGIELRIGCRILGFRMHVDTYIGDSFGPITINLGILIRLL